MDLENNTIRGSGLAAIDRRIRVAPELIIIDPKRGIFNVSREIRLLIFMSSLALGLSTTTIVMLFLFLNIAVG